MNYSTIVYNAFTTEGKFVSDYFISECKKAERDEFITPEMFFAGCLSVCNGLKTEIKKTFYNWKTNCVQYDEQGNELPFNIDEISYPFNGLQVDNNHIDYIINMIEIAKIELIDLPDAVKIGEKIDELIAEKFGGNDTTNPLIFDMDLITGLHNNFRSYIFETTDIDTFKNYFREQPMQIRKRKGITISELCYLFGLIEHKQTGVSNFAEWMKNHIGKTNYGSKKNELIEMAENAKTKRSGFSLTTPQEKALENKRKIDNLIKLMQMD